MSGKFTQFDAKLKQAFVDLTVPAGLQFRILATLHEARNAAGGGDTVDGRSAGQETQIPAMIDKLVVAETPATFARRKHW